MSPNWLSAYAPAPRWTLWLPFVMKCFYMRELYVFYGPATSPSHSVLMVPGEDPSK